MSKTLQERHAPTAPYIRVNPDFFEKISKGNLTFVDFEELREGGVDYERTDEDEFADVSRVEFTAEVWKDELTAQLFVFVPHTGRLYACWSVLEAADIVRHLKEHEATKIKKKSQAIIT